METLKTVGKSLPLLNVRNLVTGRAKFTDDIEADLFVKILRSPHAHAEVTKIDTSKAEKLDGVEAILTYKNVPQKLMSSAIALCHRSSYAIDKHVRYVGDYVAAVAATSEAIAEAALDLIDVEYKILPAVFDPEEAAKPEAPKLYPMGNVYGNEPGPEKEGKNEPTLEEWGDIEKGFKEADLVFEDSYFVDTQVHSALEPHGCMAEWDGDKLLVWPTTQTPWELRALLADYFEIPESKVRVLTEYIGGGFGGKYTGRHQAIPPLLSRMTGGKKVKLMMTREETQYQVRRPRVKAYVKMGVKKDGTITAIYWKGYWDIGAYGSFVAGTCGFWNEGGILSYKTANARFEGWDVHTNRFRSECFRSVQAPFMVYTMESAVEQVAEKLGMDPIEFRLKNAPRSGDMMPPTPYINNSHGYLEGKLDIYPVENMMREVLDKIEWKKKWKGFGKPVAVDGPKRRGIGLAYGDRYSGYNYSSTTNASIIINPDGSAIVHSGAQEVGQGINTTLCMLAAESFGIAFEDVDILTADTTTGQYDFMNARSSHQLASVGHALLMASEDAKRKISEIVAPEFEAKPEDIEIKGKKVYVKGHPGGAKLIKDVMEAPVTGSYTGPKGVLFPEVSPGVKPREPVVVAIEVEVDTETGEVTPIKLVSAFFPGRMINPKVVRGQNIGGTVQSLGMALWEECKYDEKTSTWLSQDFTDYRLPRALDIPEIVAISWEEVDETLPPHQALPYGGRGIGEMGCSNVPGAVTNAIYNAIGIRVKTSPMTAEAVLEALRKGGK